VTGPPQYWADSRTRPARDHQAPAGSGSTVTTISLRTAEVDGRARAVFLMYQAIDRNSPFLDRRSQNPGSPGVLSLEP
jgi:hypothetical protein